MEGVTLAAVAQDSTVHLPSACLPLPSPRVDLVLAWNVSPGPFVGTVSSEWKHS